LQEAAQPADNDVGVRSFALALMESDVQFLALKSRISLQRYFEPTERVTLAAGVIACCPTLWPGDLLTVETTTFEQVQIGDIVLYQRSGRFFIHRVLRKSSATGSDRHSLVTFRSACDFLARVPAFRLTFFPDSRVWDLIQ